MHWPHKVWNLDVHILLEQSTWGAYLAHLLDNFPLSYHPLMSTQPFGQIDPSKFRYDFVTSGYSILAQMKHMKSPSWARTEVLVKSPKSQTFVRNGLSRIMLEGGWGPMWSWQCASLSRVSTFLYGEFWFKGNHTANVSLFMHFYLRVVWRGSSGLN